jgi:hypothetical protein
MLQPWCMHFLACMPVACLTPAADAAHSLVLQNLGRTTCARYVGASPACSNTSAWMSTASQWVLEPAGGFRLVFIRSVVRSSNLCSPCCYVLAALWRRQQWGT